jgi:hypothetical protein
MKYPLLAILCICFFQFAQAQDQFDDRNPIAISAGFELGLPAQSIYSVALGGSLKVEVPVAHKFSLTATGGITSLDYKSGAEHALGTPGSDTFIPLKGGVKYYAAPGFYLEGELGTAIETAHYKQDLFAYSIGPGFVIPVNHGKSGVDIGFRYESWSKSVLRETGLRVAYRFGW